MRTGAADVVGAGRCASSGRSRVTRAATSSRKRELPRTSACEQGAGSIPADPPSCQTPAPRGGPSAAPRSPPPPMSPRSPLACSRLSLSTVVHITKWHRTSAPASSVQSPREAAPALRDRPGGETRPSVRPSRRLHKPTSAPRPTQGRHAWRAALPPSPTARDYASAQWQVPGRSGSRGRSIPRRSRARCAPLTEQKQSPTLPALPPAPSPTARVKRAPPRRHPFLGTARLNLSDRATDSKTGQLLHGHPRTGQLALVVSGPAGRYLGPRALNSCPARAALKFTVGGESPNRVRRSIRDYWANSRNPQGFGTCGRRPRDQYLERGDSRTAAEARRTDLRPLDPAARTAPGSRPAPSSHGSQPVHEGVVREPLS